MRRWKIHRPEGAKTARQMSIGFGINIELDSLNIRDYDTLFSFSSGRDYDERELSSMEQPYIVKLLDHSVLPS
jgi:hypothetical protein